MKTAIIAISMIMMLLLTGGMALAAPPTPPGQGHGQGVEQSQEQNQNQSQGIDQNEQNGQGQDKDKSQGKGPDKDKSQSSTQHGPAFDKRHGAAGVVSNLSTSCSGAPSGCTDGYFDLQTNQGTITVLVTSSTHFSVKDNESATISDISNGDLVNVNGTRDSKNNLIAKIVHVIPTRASFEHFVGTVDSYTAASSGANGNITIKDRRTGQDVTFTVTSTTKIEMPQGHTLASGDLVTIVAARGGTNNTATGIVVEAPDKDNS